MLPRIDGFEVCREIRRRGDTPILMLTARDDDVDSIVGLELGADDYVTKPFNPRALVARVKAILRRTSGAGPRRSADRGRRRSGSTHARREATVGERRLELRSREFDLLAALARDPGVVLTRDTLLEDVWGTDFPGETRTVDVHVGRGPAQARRRRARGSRRSAGSAIASSRPVASRSRTPGGGLTERAPSPERPDRPGLRRGRLRSPSIGVGRHAVRRPARRSTPTPPTAAPGPDEPAARVPAPGRRRCPATSASCSPTSAPRSPTTGVSVELVTADGAGRRPRRRPAVPIDRFPVDADGRRAGTSTRARSRATDGESLPVRGDDAAQTRTRPASPGDRPVPARHARAPRRCAT